MNNINGIQFKEMLQSGAANLNNRHAEIDSLNVFPVPDGDTGTNMSMTFTSGVNEACNVASDDLSIIAKALSKGLLMGARGNSGVILSQIFRGLYQSLEGKQDINVLDLANAFSKGSEVAYKAVMRPVEGTILTVIRESSYYTLNYVKENNVTDFAVYFEKFIEFAKESLENTPNLLPVLKEVGVVDSGGAGLVTVLEGFNAYILGKPFVYQEVKSENKTVASDIENEEFGYCTEFILRLSENGFINFTEEKLKNTLAKLGNSIVVVQDDDLVKVHVHTLTPGDALNKAQRYGEFVKLKIENMQEQHHNLTEGAASNAQPVKLEKKKYAIIAVAAGEGLCNLFKDYRVDHIISGGQTMNPSTEDFVAAIKKVNAENIIILPNNSNIILAAQQAAIVCDDLNISVLPTKSFIQGLSACIMFNPEVDLETNLDEMNSAVSHVKTGQITYAIKDTTFEGLEIHENDYMGMYEKNIVVANPDMFTVIQDLLKQMIDEDDEIITVLVGENTPSDAVDYVESFINDNYDLEVEIVQADQPVYNFVFGVE